MEFHPHLAEDRMLARGVKVTARWIDKGFYYSSVAEVVEVRPREVTVKLLKAPKPGGDFHPGSRVTLPRISDQTRWSSDCCVRILKSPRLTASAA